MRGHDLAHESEAPGPLGWATSGPLGWAPSGPPGGEGRGRAGDEPGGQGAGQQRGEQGGPWLVGTLHPHWVIAGAHGRAEPR